MLLGQAPWQSPHQTVVTDIEESVLGSADVGHHHVVGGRATVFVLLAGEDVEGGHVDLGMSVLSSLGSGGIDDLARSILDDDVSTLLDGRALSGVREGSSGFSHDCFGREKETH